MWQSTPSPGSGTARSSYGSRTAQYIAPDRASRWSSPSNPTTSSDASRALRASGSASRTSAGDWHTDDLPGLVALVIRNVELWRRDSRLARVERFRPHFTPRQSPRKARRNIRYHYDLGNDFYRLFLDESMTYSCAVWEPGDTLGQAQERKLRMICDKLALPSRRPRARDRLRLGQLRALWPRATTALASPGSRSRRNSSSSRARVSPPPASPTGSRSCFRTTATLEGQFTKIASIEMLEAIGYSPVPDVLRRLRSAPRSRRARRDPGDRRCPTSASSATAVKRTGFSATSSRARCFHRSRRSRRR